MSLTPRSGAPTWGAPSAISAKAKQPQKAKPANREVAKPADQLLHYRFGGLNGLRRHGHFKEVRVVDPFQQTVLHFPTPLTAENWLVSSFGRSLACTVPTEPMSALDRGRVIKTRCSLLLQTGEATIADFVAVKLDERTSPKWQLFQSIALAHGWRPELRTIEDVRGDLLRLQNLERMRQQLVQHIGDERVHRATALVERFIGAERLSTMGALCAAVVHDLLPFGAVECAAISMYRHGAIDMNISEATYGAHTTLQLL